MTTLNLSQLRWMTIALLAGSLAACGSNPVDSSQVSIRSTPSMLVKRAESGNGKIMWGGVILSSANLETGTQIEVLSFPLDHRQHPMTHRNSTGRFLIKHAEYLETVDYSAGRLVTVLGELAAVGKGQLGSVEYDYVELNAESLYLWRADGSDVAPSFSVGIGINLTN